MKLDKLRVLVFDEADELLSLGFWPDMREIQKYMPEEARHGLFSATMPQRVVSLARVFLTEPEFVSLTEGGVRAPEEIEHWHFMVPANEKEKALLRILRYEEPDSALVFCNTRDDVRFVTRYLQRNEIDADMIQGEMTQAAREAVMKRIKAGELRVLVATDVAARGIDISDLSHVISYTSPVTPEVYTHRTGRTGRAGKSGTAISLVSGLDIGNFRTLQKVNRIVIPERKLPDARPRWPSAKPSGSASRSSTTCATSPGATARRARRHTCPWSSRCARRPQGQRLLSAVLYEYLEHRHVATPVRDEKRRCGAAAQTTARRRGRPRRGARQRAAAPASTRRGGADAAPAATGGAGGARAAADADARAAARSCSV